MKIAFNQTFYLPQDIDFDGFQKFLDLFLDCEAPADLSKHLFLSFLRPYQAHLTGNTTLNCMAALSSTTACVPITSHSTRGIQTLSINFNFLPMSLSLYASQSISYPSWYDKCFINNISTAEVHKIFYDFIGKYHLDDFNLFLVVAAAVVVAFIAIVRVN